MDKVSLVFELMKVVQENLALKNDNLSSSIDISNLERKVGDDEQMIEGLKANAKKTKKKYEKVRRESLIKDSEICNLMETIADVSVIKCSQATITIEQQSQTIEQQAEQLEKAQQKIRRLRAERNKLQLQLADKEKDKQ